MTPRQVDCPYCGAAPPDPCTNKTGRTNGHSHSARRLLAADPVQAALVAKETRP